MIRDSGFDRTTHEYLDGDIARLSDERAQASADHFAHAIDVYTNRLAVPGREVDRAVMAVLREQRRSPARKRSVWRWIVQPQDFRVRPMLAAAVVLLAVGLSAVVLPRGRVPTPDTVSAASGASTVLVQFELRATDAQRVALAGSFNDWNGDVIPLVKNSATGVWTVTVALAPGEHQYLFVIDGEQWIPDPRAHAQVDDGFGERNSVITVGPRGLIRS